MNDLPSLEQVSEVYSYDPATGSLTMRIGTTRKRAGDAAGVKRKGYICITIGGRYYQAARICWLLHHGEWPSGLIDHINCDPSDNRISNLRVATFAQNNANRACYRKKHNLPKGVMPGRKGKFRAQISIDGRCRYIGTFATPETAHEAYLREAKAAFGEFVRAS